MASWHAFGLAVQATVAIAHPVYIPWFHHGDSDVPVLICATLGRPNEWCVPGAPNFDPVGMVCHNEGTDDEMTCQMDGADMVCRTRA